MEHSAQHFQQLALALVQTVKSLQNFSNQIEQLSDKDIEAKLKILKDILDFRFKLPPNIFISIFQVLVKVLTQQIDISKDFILLKILEILSLLSMADATLLNQAPLEESEFDLIKWSISQIKETQSKSTPEVQVQSFKVCKEIVCKLQNEKLSQMLPGVSSIATKVISCDYKVNAKVKVELIDIWECILASHLSSMQEELNDKSKSKRDFLLLLKSNPKIDNNPESPQDNQVDETLIRLSDCFKYINQNLYKVEDQKVKDKLKLMGVKLNKQKSLQRKDCIESRLTYNLMIFYLLCGGNILEFSHMKPKVSIQNQIYGEFKRSIINLQKTKQMVNYNQRTLALKHLQIHSKLLQQLRIDLHTDQDLALLLTNLKSIIKFDSQRFLIQEVQEPIMTDQKSIFKEENNKKIIDEYIAKSIDIFKDDQLFFKQVRQFLKSLPQDFAIQSFNILFEELTDLEKESKETSQLLQDKCRLLFILSLISDDKRLLEFVIDKLDQVDFNVKYPIQERFYALLYYTMLKLVKTLQIKSDLSLSTKNKLFILSFSGLSSQLEIVCKISFNILTEFKKQYELDTFSELLKTDNGYFFHNIFAKLRYFNVGFSNKHLLLILRSLKAHAQDLMQDVLYDLIQLVISNLDKSMSSQDQGLILLTMDIALLISEHIRDYSSKLPKNMVNYEQDESTLSMDDKVKKALYQKEKSLPNIMRKLILRLQPYITPTTQPLYICTKTLQIFKNSVFFLAYQELFKETKNEPFTSEDAANVRIPCALSLISYELYDNFLKILKHPSSYQHKIKVIEVLTELVRVKHEFLFSVNRLQDDICPQILKISKEVMKNNEGFIEVKVIEEIAKFFKEVDQVVITDERLIKVKEQGNVVKKELREMLEKKVNSGEQFTKDYEIKLKGLLMCF